jgi:proteic killer suppression protein
MVRSFACTETEALFYSRAVFRFRNIERVARRKLLQIQAATELSSLRVHRVEIVDYH